MDINRIIATYRDRPALVRLGKNRGLYTFADVARLAAILRARFRDMGILPGSRVAIYMENSPLHFLVFFLSWTDDFLFTPLNHQMPLASALEESSPDVVICHETPPNTGAIKDRPLFISAEDLWPDLEAGKKSTLDFPEVNLDQECSLVFTSGSTGRPKGVVHTIGNHVYSAAGVISFFGVSAEDRWLVSLPINHVGGLSIFGRTFLSGAAAVFPESRHALEKAVLENEAGFISVVATQLIRLMKRTDTIDALSIMRGILLGGSSVPEWVIDKALDLSLPVISSYGSTESCSLVTAVPPGSDRKTHKTAGKLLPHRKLATGADGRILLGGKTRFAYYLVGNDRVFPFDSGWFATSDLGQTNADGNWIIKGRIDEIFISGGENINPFEIEKALMRVTGIDTALVVPAPHPEFGLVPWAFVSAPAGMGAADISSMLRKTLPPFKIPKRILFISPDAKSASIKADRAFYKQKAMDMAGGRS